MGILSNWINGAISNNFALQQIDAQSETAMAQALLSAQSAEKIADQNLAYQMDYNNQVFNRADTAVQRAAADMQAAGLSKTLAAGQPSQVAGTSSAPQRADTSGVLFNNLISAYGAISDLKMKQAQTDNISADTDYKKLQVENYVEDLNHKWENLSADTDYKRLLGVEQGIINQYKGDILSTQIQSSMASIVKDYASAAELLANRDLILKKCETEVLSQQKLSADIKRANLDYIIAEFDLKVKEYDFGINSNYGWTSSGARSGIGMVGQDLETTLDKIGKNIGQGLKNIWSNISNSNLVDKLVFWK